MNAQLKELIQVRYELLRDIRNNRKQWLKTNRDAKSSDSQKDLSWQPATDTLIGFPNTKMPSKHGLQCASYLVRNFKPLECP